MSTKSHIGFKIISSPNEHKSKNVPPSNANVINLLDPLYHFNFLDIMPKNFTITSNNGSCKFNIELLKDTSSVISEFLQNTPDEIKFDLKIDDETNVLSKFEKLYQGQLVLFNKEDTIVYDKINNLLNIQNMPDLKNYNGSPIKIIMRKRRFHNFLKENAPHTFKIKTSKNEYNCNVFGVLSSKIIQELISTNQIKDQYLLNFDDKCEEFQQVCDILNFKEVKITTSNMRDLKTIFTILQIDPILNIIDRYIQNYEDISQIIDKNKELIYSIEGLFDNLFNIKEKTVEKVKDFIVNSFWSKTEDDVKELAAFIVQVERTDIYLHHELIELLTKLNNEANNSNKLEVLKPFIVSKFMSNVGETITSCSFLYNLYKNGFISKEELLNILRRSLPNTSNQDTLSNLYTWFLPEIIEVQPNNVAQIRNYLDVNNLGYLKTYLDNGFDKYNEERNSGEPNNEISKALIHDDVDKLTELITKNSIDISKALVPCNIYSPIVQNGRTNYIDYAAEFGSLKCFEYLFLNHEKVDKMTFNYAISGGNYEIVKIVDQNALPDDHIQYQTKIKNNPQEQFSDIIPAISKHKYNLFDWIFEHKYTKNNIDGDTLNELVKISMLNGNAHSLIEIIDKGYSFVINTSINAYQDMIESSARKGFYMLTKLLYNIITEKAKGNIVLQLSPDIKGIIDSMEIMVTEAQPGQYVPFWKRSQNMSTSKKKKSMSNKYELSSYHSNEQTPMSIYNYSWDFSSAYQRSWHSKNKSAVPLFNNNTVQNESNESNGSNISNVLSIQYIWEHREELFKGTYNQKCPFNIEPLSKRVVMPYKTWDVLKKSQFEWDFSQAHCCL